MTTITKEFTKEQLIAKAQEQIAFCRDTKITGEGRTHVNQCSSLFEIALAALTAEPVAWTDAEELRDLRTVGFCEMFTVEPVSKDADMYRAIPLYTDSPVPERERIRREHAEWSDATFGDVGPVGPLKHLSKEALEAAAEPDDLSEWADMQFLLWDAQRRAGITDEQVTQAMVDKLKVNKQREWPEPKDGKPRLHIKEQPAPVVPEEHYQRLSELYHAQEKRLFKIAQRIKGPAFDKYSHSPSQAIDVLESALFGENEATCRAAMLQGSQPVSNRDELLYAQVKAVADLYALCWQSGEVVTYTPDPEKATIWLNNYSGTCAQEYVKLERLQEALAGNSPVIPEDLRRAFEAVARLNNEMYCWTSCMSYNGSYNGEPEGLLKRNIREIEHIMDSCRATMLQANQRDLSQPVGPQVAEYEQIMLQAGSSPVTPDGWISCSERMPDNDESKPIAIFTGKCLGQGMFVATYDDDGFFDYWEGMEIIGVSHWMPLPEPPQK